MGYEIGEHVMAYNNLKQEWGLAIIKDIRYNVRSIVDDYIYPVLYDVLFENGWFSSGLFETSLMVLTE